MVWNSTQSALYKVIDTHNSSVSERKNAAEKRMSKNLQKTPVFLSQNSSQKSPRRRSEKSCRSCSQNAEHAGCGDNSTSNMPADPISRIMSDRDMLLVAGLIFILWRENADRKLIMALAIVLLG